MLKILLPTDFSKNAWNAIRHALRLFEEQDCAFYILHTYTPAFYRMDYLVGGPSFSAIPDVGVDEALKGLEGTLEDIRREFPNPKHQFKTLSAFNLLTDEINDVAREKSVDLVIMGTKGATGAKEVFMGTNAVYVIRKALIPVMIIPEEASYKPVKNIVFACDFWSQYQVDEIKTLTDLATIFGAEITVLHITEEYTLTEGQLKNKAHLQNILEGIPHQFEDLQGGLMPGAVMDYLADNEFELLVMMNRRHSLIEQLLWPQNVERIGFQVKIPFLVIRDTSRVSK